MFRIRAVIRLVAALVAVPATLAAQERTTRIEAGPVITTSKDCYSCDFREAAGARFTVNLTRNIAGEVEGTRIGYRGYEWNTNFNLKITHRMEERRAFKIFGMNVFGVVGPGLLNRHVSVAISRPMAIRPTGSRRQTDLTLGFGGGVEIVPAHRIAIRFEIMNSTFLTPTPYSSQDSRIEHLTHAKLSAMVRF